MPGWRSRASRAFQCTAWKCGWWTRSGVDLDWDGEQRGELLFKGPWIAAEYYNDPRSEETFIDGWYHSGDIASVDRLGNIQIGDRVKDMVKSGGEWISSVDLETAIIAHPGVLEAAVIAIPHPTWQERPLACVVPNAEYRDTLDKSEVLEFIRPRFRVVVDSRRCGFHRRDSQDQRGEVRQESAARPLPGLPDQPLGETSLQQIWRSRSREKNS